MEVAQADNSFDKFGCEGAKERENISYKWKMGFRGKYEYF